MSDISEGNNSHKQPYPCGNKEKNIIPMFKSLTLKNFRTHKNSTIQLTDLTLIIGSNNSGKSNFLNGVHYISKLIGAFNPYKPEITYELRSNNYHPNKHSLCQKGEPISFNCEWVNENCEIRYDLSIYPDEEVDTIIYGQERLIFKQGDFIETHECGYSEKSNSLLLRWNMVNSKIIYRPIIDDFFHSLSSIYYYNLQPSFLKGDAYNINYIDGKGVPYPKKDFFDEYFKSSRFPNIPSEIGKEGGNLQELLHFVKEKDEETSKSGSSCIALFNQTASIVDYD